MTPSRITPLTPQRVAGYLRRRGYRVARRGARAVNKLRHAPHNRTQLVVRIRKRAARNHDFVTLITARTGAPGYWQQFAAALADAWYDGGRTAMLVRTGLRSWRSLPGIDTGAALEVGHRALNDGDIAWADAIADGVLVGDRTHQRANRLKALVHAERGEWWPAQDCWRIARGGNRYRLAARRWAINERGRHRARRLIALMPDADKIDNGRGDTLADLARVPATEPDRFDSLLGSVLINNAVRDHTAGLRPFMQAWSTTQQRERIALAPTEVAQSVRSMNVHRFRSYLTGRSVALVANSPSLLGVGLGEQIDSHDVVIRFNSFALQPADTGSKINVHVAFHKYDFNLDVPVDVRILLSAKEDLWRESIKARIRPGAQTWLGDGSLRWPAVQLGLIKPDDPYKLPTAGFNLLRLLLHLGVTSSIDMYGFDFYESGMHRLQSAAAIPHSPGHNSRAEKEWVMAHAVTVGDHVIGMQRAGQPAQVVA